VRTRVGYAGGSSDDPTYRNLSGHSETIQIDFDPAQITYEDLLEIFWGSHNPAYPSYSRQYASIIFYHDESQRQAALASKEREGVRRGEHIHTEITPLEAFYLAEDYHQKYYLQTSRALMDEFGAIYPDLDRFVNSTAVARANGYVGGNGSPDQLAEEIDRLGLSPQAQQVLRDAVR
jgi:peptide-methionine (S)-S-oxide reductase